MQIHLTPRPWQSGSRVVLMEDEESCGIKYNLSWWGLHGEALCNKERQENISDLPMGWNWSQEVMHRQWNAVRTALQLCHWSSLLNSWDWRSFRACLACPGDIGSFFTVHQQERWNGGHFKEPGSVPEGDLRAASTYCCGESLVRLTEIKSCLQLLPRRTHTHTEKLIVLATS